LQKFKHKFQFKINHDILNIFQLHRIFFWKKIKDKNLDILELKVFSDKSNYIEVVKSFELQEQTMWINVICQLEVKHQTEIGGINTRGCNKGKEKKEYENPSMVWVPINLGYP